MSTSCDIENLRGHYRLVNCKVMAKDESSDEEYVRQTSEEIRAEIERQSILKLGRDTAID